MDKSKIIIVTPIYTTAITATEAAALRQCKEVLPGYPKCIVKPRSLDIVPIIEAYPVDCVVSFDDSYFKGIAGYNCLMMSTEFYRAFAGFEYILIYQTDAWVFSDQLAEWCDKGYDYVGAPWIPKPKYRKLYYQAFACVKHIYDLAAGRPDYRQLWYKAGNGGLSLRRTSSFTRTTVELRPVVEMYLRKNGIKFYNEDIFWSIGANRHGAGLKIPEWREALQFAFDMHPSVCFELNGGRLPFGCHGWNKTQSEMWHFWQHLIDWEKG